MPRRPALAEQVADGIQAAVLSGVHRPDEWLPSWDALAVEYQVNRRTVGRALEILAERGAVDLVPGRGARVRGHVRRDAGAITRVKDGWRGFHAIVSESGAEAWTVTSIEEVPAPSEAARWLGVPHGTPVVCRSRVQGEIRDGERRPHQLSATWLLPAVVTELPILREADTGPGGMGSRLEEAGYTLRYEDAVTARTATDEEAARLEAPPGTAVVEVWRRCYDQADRILEVTRRVINPARHVLVYRYP